ncbi:Sodium bicarbonate cotransporter 3 [Bagarius yarrelli]|uniref:Sodium bicarbonate cotransporter 3 n=1 Tax=Bagarius yarrelli TaxID=175774 RepID=A0A556VUM7_BAGYA|nr:Sodium bicarbonate cotransporter 3 [Bagarius yarrelli]
MSSTIHTNFEKEVLENTPSQRVQFILGTEDDDEEHIPHDLFTELDELHFLDGEMYEWKEMARWLKFEEDVEDGGERWSKPYVATLSLHSLFELRSCIMNGTVLLDMRANSIDEIADMIIDSMVASKQLDECLKEKVRQAVLKRHHHQSEKKLSNRIPLVRSFADMGKKHSDPHLLDRNGLMASPQSAPGNLENSKASESRINGGSRENSTVDFSKVDMNFMKKIPAGAEASNVLVGEVDFLDRPIIAFVFHDVAYKAKDRNDLLSGIDEFLDQVTVLPPGEWDPTIRIEPPKNVPSQEKRKMPVPNGSTPQSEVIKEEEHHTGPELKRTGRIFGGLVLDVKRKAPFYWSDVRDAFSLQCLASVLFLYCACMSPVITFGGLLGETTKNNIVRFSIFMATDASSLVCYITRFTEEAFASLICIIFIYEALEKLFQLRELYPVNMHNHLNNLTFYRCQCSPPSNTTSEIAHLWNRSGFTPDSIKWNELDVSTCKKLGGKFIGPACGEHSPFIPDVLLWSIILFFTTFFLSFFLKQFRTRPATVLSISHVNSLKVESQCSAPGEQPKFLGIREQRVTGLMIFILMGVSVFMTSALKFIPMPVLYGVFLYMGASSLQGIQHQPDLIYLRYVPLWKVHVFTFVQLTCLVLLWTIKASAAAVVFPMMQDECHMVYLVCSPRNLTADPSNPSVTSDPTPTINNNNNNNNNNDDNDDNNNNRPTSQAAVAAAQAPPPLINPGLSVTPAPAAVPVNPAPLQQPANQNPELNAQGGAVQNEDELNRDWLDWLYTVSRVAVLLCIVYFYSSFSRFILVIGAVLLERIMDDGLEDDDGDSGDEGIDEAAPQPSFLTSTWSFISTFFTSLVPEVAPRAAR